MAIVTAQAYETSIINALAVSDPQLNTALGTPVRKIITAVAQEMADYNVDVNVTGTLYSIDSVSGAELDYLVGQFGFARHSARSARGSVTIRRDNGDEYMSIPYGTQFMKQSDATTVSVVFQTTAYCELAEGVLSAEIGVVAAVPGSIGNVPARSITYATSISGYVTVFNENPTSGGRDAESDEQLRQRFLSTVFRNVSGTKDQLVALALANEQVSRANLIGQESRFSEIVQTVSEGAGQPTTASVSNEAWDIDVQRVLDIDRRYWVTLVDTGELLGRGDYTVPVGGAGKTVVFGNRHDTDTIAIVPDTSRSMSHGGIAEYIVEIAGVAPETDDWYSVDTEAGEISFSSEVPQEYSGGVLTIGYEYRFMGADEFVKIEFDYLSKHNRGGIKTVDLYVDSLSSLKVSDVQYIDTDKKVTSDNKSKWVRDDGTQPSEGNYYIPLSHQPVFGSLGVINMGASLILNENEDFWLIRDATRSAGSSRGCDAVEIRNDEPGGDSYRGNTPVHIPYLQNYAIERVQAVVDEQRVVTMDIMVHEAVHRYFVVYLTLMYSVFPRDSVVENVQVSLTDWATRLPFGQTIQFSDIETVVANMPGVDNVRVSTEADAGTKMSGFGDYKAFGIIELARDGKTPIAQFSGDFRMAQNEIFEISEVRVHSRSQQGWGA